MQKNWELRWKLGMQRFIGIMYELLSILGVAKGPSKVVIGVSRVPKTFPLNLIDPRNLGTHVHAL